jgi:1,4-alpha-glucan branching enzyme
MAEIKVHFVYHTGLREDIFSAARLVGSWENTPDWSSGAGLEMAKQTGADGCPIFVQTKTFDVEEESTYHWGVRVDGPGEHRNRWGIALEVHDRFSRDRHRTLTLDPAAHTTEHEQNYYLTYCRRLGAQKVFRNGAEQPGIQFRVWAPNALDVEVVFGEFVSADNTKQTGYISDYDVGIGSVDVNGTAVSVLPLRRGNEDIWESDPDDGLLSDFEMFRHRPYMYRITRDDGSVRYRTDLYARCQIGKGSFDPQGQAYPGHYKQLDGTVGCSVIIDPEKIAWHFDERFENNELIPIDEFWNSEFEYEVNGEVTEAPPLPTRLKDLILYELHINSLGFGEARPGDFSDVMKLLEAGYFTELGINAIELMPVAEYESNAMWGYGNSHHFALEYSAGGRDQLKHLVRACHQRGIAVIIDVVYNHYHHHAERAEWGYDSAAPDRNIYYWYEGQPSDYPQPDGGYLDNYSTGYAPRWWEEKVRQMFISSAAAIVKEFHIDGFRVDMTTSMHKENKLHADGREVPAANVFGAKFLREWTYALKLIKPDVFLIAEDHSKWEAVTQPHSEGGLGFDAVWYADFYHHLIGDARVGSEFARLLRTAGRDQNTSLAMDYFAGALQASGQCKVVYHESHDEAGNSQDSHRTMVVAINGAPLFGDTRHYAEARCRLVCGLTLLSAGTPMFFMGEEIGAQKDYTYREFMRNREDLVAEKNGNGANLFQFYGDLIGLRRVHSALRSQDINIVYIHNDNRILAFLRKKDAQEFLIVCSFNNQPFSEGYTLSAQGTPLQNGGWREIFNSDATIYGGRNIGNMGAELWASEGRIHLILPANGFVVFQKTG